MSKVFIGMPMHSAWIHEKCMTGIVQCMSAMPCRVERVRGSFLPRNRDVLTKMFLESDCSHLLCLDTDIGWRFEHLQRLLGARKGCVSGVYCQKTPERELPFEFTESRFGELKEASSAPAGFMLLERELVEAVCREFRYLSYDAQGMELVGLWHPELGLSEDYSFCSRVRAIGSRVWVDPGVVVSHFGECEYRPLVPAT